MGDVYGYLAPDFWPAYSVRPYCAEQTINHACRCGSYIWHRAWGDLWYCRTCGAQATTARGTKTANRGGE